MKAILVIVFLKTLLSIITNRKELPNIDIQKYNNTENKYTGHHQLHSNISKYNYSYSNKITRLQLKLNNFIDYVLAKLSKFIKIINDIIRKQVYETNQTIKIIKTSKKNSIISWNSKSITENEAISIQSIKSKIKLKKNKSKWLSNVNDVELLRFLRAKNGNVEEAWKMITSHASWRLSQYGADSIYTKTAFTNSPLHNEIFWLGLNKQNMPVLVVRTQVHDGIYYNHDPKVYTSFVISLLEQGKQLYGLGTKTPLCLLMDRGGLLVKNGEKKHEILDFSVIPRLVDLIRFFVNTIQENYPDVLYTAKVAPAAWFFALCYKVTSRAMDPSTREKFQVIESDDLKSYLHNLISPELLPPHLGGYSKTYTSLIYVNTTEKHKNR